MTISQSFYLDDADAKLYDDNIIVRGVPKGQFLALTDNKAPANGGTTREISISLMELEQAPGGTRSTNTNIYTRQAGETEVKVTLYDGNGNAVATNTTPYS